MISEGEISDRFERWLGGDGFEKEVPVKPYGGCAKTYRIDYVCGGTAFECKGEAGNIRKAFGQIRTYEMAGYDCVVVVPNEMSTKKIEMLKAMCCETEIRVIVLSEGGRDCSDVYKHQPCYCDICDSEETFKR